MLPNNYQKLASRTECDQTVAAQNVHLGNNPYSNHGQPMAATRLCHAIIGLMGEVGELASAYEKWIHYNQNLDLENIKEELGDVMWYTALACNALGFELAPIMSANIRKLQARYPEKYEDKRAKEENRNRTKEMEQVTQNGNGWAEPKIDDEASFQVHYDPDPYSLATHIADTYLEGQVRTRALQHIERERTKDGRST